MKKNSILLLAITLLIGGFISCGFVSSGSMIDKTVVKELNIDRFLGTWYEIARFDHRFERGLVGVTANYSMRDDGKIKVLNSGYKGSLDKLSKRGYDVSKLIKIEQKPE